MGMRRRGFTLIELLVVIAIIGILAAMLFPVFARARESARKIQCLSNVKNIALAFQMYLTDYDRFPPYLTESATAALEPTLGPLYSSLFGDYCTKRVWNANPYLRWPVILDEYIKNRDVWTCPSATFVGGFGIVFDPGGADGWAHWMADHPDGYIFPCDGYYPTGWGGTVTDSVTQGYPVSYLGVRYKSAEGVFGNSIGTTESKNTDLSTSAINDPARFVVTGDSAAYTMWSPVMDVYQVCGFQGGCADWENCEDTDICGIDWAHFKAFWTDVSWRKKYTRHMGGSNFGFADGHAKWMSAETFLSQVTHQDCPCDAAGAEYHEGTIEGVGCYSNVFACPDW